MGEFHLRMLLVALIAAIICNGCSSLLPGGRARSPNELYYVAILYGLAGSPKAQLQRPEGETSGSFAADGSLVTPEAAGLSATEAFLVTGGAVNMPTAELYDSAANAIVAWPGPMNSNRQYHSATALGDGTILLAGG